ncbi:uncharacterized protein LOC116251413 [Nymphaea colorata]|uniref:F-box domain-containing protein n=1 Tax=Nymphaea colorata TaxID=210225 RepID=A0A5K1B251_9MAGN|nr:uncharacterized protein LOC116251413 [Nymphaea colorata]
MDSLLCDELLEEILQRLHSASDANSASLVSKRWLSLLRSSRTALSLRLPTGCSGGSRLCLSSFLSHYPNLSALTLVSDSPNADPCLSDLALLSLSSACRNLTQLRFLVGPVTSSSLQHLSSSCKALSSLKIIASRSLGFDWLAGFRSLRNLSVTFLDCLEDGPPPSSMINLPGGLELQLETLCFTGIGNGDVGIDWLWRNCRSISKLRLSSCEGIGNSISDPFFLNLLSGIREIELVTCRSITASLLLRVAEHCRSLVSLVVYDGGNRDALIEVIRNCGSLRKIDLRLPLDLDDDGLMAIAQNCRELQSLCLQSCVMISGESLRSLGRVLCSSLEELALVNCDAAEREPGLLTSLGQNLRSLKRLDLSYNELLLDKEMVSMLASSRNLVEISLRGCRGLTDMTISAIIKNCPLLRIIDIRQCHKITSQGVGLLLEAPNLIQILVEQSKIPGQL